ncbi:right-handed parallel beta-helix repeat-containing protein [Clostridiales bacterium]|nr:right-handed parallel beta-helix repeat-containing protein [Clostridiales bacterium]
MTRKDPSSILPDGQRYEFWEKEPVWERELFVSNTDPNASDENDGSEGKPFRTISRAAAEASPGTRVRIHAGIYRECVQPVYGGTDPEHMVSYEAYGDGDVILRASEEVTDFIPSEGWMLFRGPGPVPEGEPRIWEYDLDPELFRGYNPFCAVNILHDRLFIEYDKTDMTTYLNRRGCVFCDGKPLRQVPLYNGMGREDNTYWVEANGMKVHFRLAGDADPREHRIEVTVREQCFAPAKPFLNYIRVKGLICEHAATGAPVPQRGAISAHRGHHWIIEDCEVNWSNGVAIDVGNECWHHTHTPGEMIGYSVIRGCRIRDAGVCGIAGMFSERLLIEDNVIEGTGWQKMELSWEAGAIKLHNSVNGLIRHNVFRNTFRADHLWLDCGNENNRITGNLFLDGIEQREAIFIECTREGVNLIDNNIIWNVEGRFDPAKVPAEPGSSGWYKLREHDVVNGYGVYGEGTDRLYIAHNLIGRCRHSGYYLKPVPFRMHGLERGGTSRDAKIINNIFYECGEAAVDLPTRDNEVEGNLYVRMTGGYLRVMYPEPEVCLNLPAWQEFCGFDREGQNGWFDIDVDAEAGTVTFRETREGPFGFRGEAERLKLIRNPGDVREVTADAASREDRFDTERGAAALPGPYAVWEKTGDGVYRAKI